VLDTDEVKLLVQMICERQIAMIKFNHGNFADEEYVKLEKLKVKVKELEDKSC
jgi:hypothetical protein